MDDLEDVVEAVVDLEDIVEEVAEPDDLLEDIGEQPGAVIAALVTAGAAVVALLLLVVTLTLLVFAVGFFPVVAALTLLALVATIVGFAAFLSLRTDFPRRVERQLNRAHERASDTSGSEATMTEDEAIEELKAQYADGELTEQELERALDDLLTSDDPEAVVREYEREYGRE